MFIGHLAVGLSAKRLAPRTSLGTLMAAALMLDLLWPLFLLLGLEQVRIDPGNTAFTPLNFVRYPLTHSLAMALVWSALSGLVYRARTQYAAGAWCVGAGVFSHWVLDFVTHRPDLQLYPGSAVRVGLGLWNSVAGTLVVEGLLFVAGLWVYLATTRAKDRTGTLALWSFVAVMITLYVANAIGPPPPNEQALATVGLLMWLFVTWVYWIDRHREIRGRESATMRRV